MNIGMVLANSDFPPDIRVENEARSLLSAGHRVFLLSLRTGESPASSVWNGIEIKRIAPLPFLPIRKLNSLLYLLSMRDFQWKRAIRSLMAHRAIDVIHVHDLPMLRTALSAARGKGVPVIADLHENYPALIRLSFARRKPRLAGRFMSPSRWERLERRWLNSCDHILVVVEEARERLLAKGVSAVAVKPPLPAHLGLLRSAWDSSSPPHTQAEKITVIENTVDVDHFLSLPIDAGLVSQFKNDFAISYVGGFSPHRGLDTAVKAIPRILRDIPNAKLLLVGDGEMRPQLRSLAEAIGVVENVLLTGWVEFSKIPSYIAASVVCIVPHTSTDHTETTSPHKLYQYMLLGKPVVVSSCRPLRRVVEGARCGLVFKSGDADSFADCILKLKDPALRKEMGDAGKDAVLERYNWKKSEEKLLRVYDGLVKASR